MTLLQGINKLVSAAGRSSVHPQQHRHLYLLLKNSGFTQVFCLTGATAATTSGGCRNPTDVPKKTYFMRVLDSSASQAAEQERA